MPILAQSDTVVSPGMPLSHSVTLSSLRVAEQLFDQLPDVVFFAKDREGRYLCVNHTLAQRCGFGRKQDLIGLTPGDVFPAELAAGYMAQDQHVIRYGHPLHDRLELHFYPNREPGWCVSHKFPLFDDGGRVAGLAGISRDLRAPDKQQQTYRHVARAVAHVQERFAKSLGVEDLARIANLSVAQFERHIQRIYELSPKQLITRTRLEEARRRLEGEMSIAEIAFACGYADHSAFSRQFKLVVGLTPAEYRSLRRH
jgi:AraC-like DNA-binding protein